jgi:cytochrome c oxidase subunit 3
MAEIVAAPESLPVGSIGHHANGWWAMLFVILSEAALFAYLLFGYFYFAMQPHAAWPPGGLPHIKLALPDTIILLLSSVAVWWAERATRRGARGPMLLGLGIGLLLGIVFVLVQVYEWHEKPFAFASSSYSSLYFTTTGFHMAHVVAGNLMLAALLVWAALGYFGPRRNAAVTIGALYWHFVDAVWLVLFFTFYVTPYLG